MESGEKLERMLVKNYRRRRGVEALRWTNTDERRARFAAWFGDHGAVFETRGAEIILPEQEAGLRTLVAVGGWVLCISGCFTAMSDPLFTQLYMEEP